MAAMFQGLFMRVRRFPTADETIAGWGFREALDGGKGSHQAIAAARLGLPTSFVGKLGNDRLGVQAEEWMREAGVDLTYLSRSPTLPTGCGFVMIDPDGVPAIVSAMGANEELCPADIDRAEVALGSAQIVMVTFEIPVATALYAVRRAKELGAFTILTPGPAEELPPGSLQGLDLLVPNLGEAKVLTGRAPGDPVAPAVLASTLQERFELERVVITMGANGALIADGPCQQTIPAFKVQAVDTPGAGDAFLAALAFALEKGGSLADSARFACLAAARAVTIAESIPAFGTLEQILQFAAAHQFAIPGCVLQEAPDSNRASARVV